MLTRLQQFMPALVLALIGLAVVIGGSDFEIGSLTAMGPGFMPVLLGCVLLLLAFVLLLLEWRTLPVAAALPSARPLLCAGLSIVVWALLAERAGFVLASVAQLLLAYAAISQPDWRKVLYSSAVITALAFITFVLLLGLPLPAVGW